MAATGRETWLESEGQAVDVLLQYTVQANAVAYAQGWMGITSRSGDSGDTVSLQVDGREYQFTVPAALSVTKGQTVYIEFAQMGPNHMPPDAAYSTTAGAGKIALFKATANKDGNNTVMGKLLTGVQI